MAKWTRRTQPNPPPGDGRFEFDLRRFVKLCSMLTSSHEGERASAALKASDMLRTAGLTWTDVLKDLGALLEHVAGEKPDDAEARVRKFWKN